jgi:protein-S-isoprenylcysteine O-methyltransferase Ste14
MKDKVAAAAGSVIFFVLAPGTVAGWLPYVMTGWRIEPPFLGFVPLRFLGGGMIVAGIAGLVHCFARFALEGRGTPAPVAPTETLIVTGLYRYVRNPMYVAVVVIITGQALLLGSVSLLRYAGIVWLCFFAFVLLYEEPTLRGRYGETYDLYRANVRRWLPRTRPWIP